MSHPVSLCLTSVGEAQLGYELVKLAVLLLSSGFSIAELFLSHFHPAGHQQDFPRQAWSSARFLVVVQSNWIVSWSSSDSLAHIFPSAIRYHRVSVTDTVRIKLN